MVEKSNKSRIISIVTLAGEEGLKLTELFEEAESSYGIPHEEIRMIVQEAIDFGDIGVDDDLKIRAPEFMKCQNLIGSSWP